MKQRITSLVLVPSGGGCFEVAVDGRSIYSKLKTGVFPEPQAVLDAVEEQVS